MLDEGGLAELFSGVHVCVLCRTEQVFPTTSFLSMGIMV